MKLGRVHHIGYLVKDISRSAAAFEGIGYVREEGCYDPVQQSDILFLRLGGLRVELVAPEKGSDIYPLLGRYREAPYHICYEVEDLEASAGQLAGEGFVLFRPPAPAVAIGEGARVAFLMKRGMGMVELVETGTAVQGLA